MRMQTSLLAIVAITVAFIAPTAMAATGEVTWTNPPENTGKIRRNDDDDGDDYTYNINAGDTNPPDYVPQVGDRVTFTPRGRRATNVTIDPAGGDPAASSAIAPASAALGLLAVGGIYCTRRRQRECV